MQDALDVYQVVHSYERTQPSATIQPGGKRIYLDYYSDGSVGDWEEDELLTDATFNPLTPSFADRITGHWQFASNTGLVVWLSGKSYDLYGSAADICQDWAGLVKLEFDVSTQSRNYKRNQQYTSLMDMAERYRARALPQIAHLIRMDTPVDQPLLGPYTIEPGNDLGRGRVR